MYNLKTPVKQLYSEKEAAEALGISVASLHEILDEHIFDGANPRPSQVEFTSSDLLIIGYWAEKTTAQNLVSISKRR